MFIQYYDCHVSQPLLLEQLREIGIDISSGELSHLLTEGHDNFHQEKEDLLSIGLQHFNDFALDYMRAQNLPVKYQILFDYLKGSSYPSKEAWELALKDLSITAEYAIRIATQGVLIGISFWKYLEDRIKKLKKIPNLANIMKMKFAQQNEVHPVRYLHRLDSKYFIEFII